jgi:hypothetical protein
MRSTAGSSTASASAAGCSSTATSPSLSSAAANLQALLAGVRAAEPAAGLKVFIVLLLERGIKA